MRINIPVVGFLIGLIMPFVGLKIMHFLWGHGEGFGDFMHSLFVLPDFGGKVLTLSLLANLIPFLYFNIKRLDYALRGVVVITMLYALVVVLLKFNFFK